MSQKAWILLSAFVLNSIELIFGKEYGCTWQDPQLNATYDLCELQLGNGSQNDWYRVKDKRATVNVSAFEYFFNVASDILRDMDMVDSCYNTTLREERNYPLGYCDDVYNYTCRGKIKDITITST